MKVIATKHGKFAPRDGSEPFALKPGDEVPAALAQAALEQEWGRKVAEPKAAAKKTGNLDVAVVDAEDI